MQKGHSDIKNMTQRSNVSIRVFLLTIYFLTKGFNWCLIQNSTIAANKVTGGIVKTVILPYDQINNLKAELEHLKQYRITQKALFEEAIQGYQKDKVIRL